ncbi:hypothetical protein Bpfe_022036, partial [Biomphalaria pfeifferi]
MGRKRRRDMMVGGAFERSRRVSLSGKINSFLISISDLPDVNIPSYCWSDVCLG